MLDRSHNRTTEKRAVGAGNQSLGIFAESSSSAQKRAKDDQIRKRFRLLNTARRLLPDERIAACQNKIAPGHDHVIVKRSSKGRVSFNHLVRCESYSCPICAFQRAEEDRHALSLALAECQLRKYTPVLVTETIRHDGSDKLPDLQKALQNAHNDVFSGRWYVELKNDWKIVGKVASWETTYGRNGWHPHRHILFFLDGEYSPAQIYHLAELLKERWIEKIQALGHDASWEHGLDVRTADSAIADYIAKFGHEPLQKHWAVEHELTKGVFKSVMLEGLTPFDLLAAASGDANMLQAFGMVVKWPNLEELQRWAGKLYTQWFQCFKGKARIHWGDMWTILGIDEALEHHAKEAEALPKEEFEELCSIPRDSWRRIADFTDDMRSELAIYCQDATAASLKLWFHRRGLVAEILISSPPDSSKICEKPMIERQQAMFQRSNVQW